MAAVVSKLKKVSGSMISVKVFNNDIDSALRLFKRKMKDSGVLEEYKDKRYYVKPSTKRRTKHNNAVQKQRKQDRLLNSSL